MNPSPTPRVSIGLVGTSFMGIAHSRALYLLPTLEDTPAALPALAAVCGRDRDRTERIRRRFNWSTSTLDWRELVQREDLDAVVLAATNDLHGEPSILAAGSGKSVLCEKPLARDAAEAKRMLDAATDAGIVHMCAFNYRFFPAIRLARELLETGELGELYHFRSRFLIGSAADPNTSETAWRLRRETAGSGVVGDLLAHHIDLARYLVGEPSSVSATTRTWAPQRAGVEVDVEDAVSCVIDFAGGAVGSLEATRVTPGHVLESVVEVDGSAGSLRFDLRTLNELTVSTAEGQRTVEVTEPHHPFLELWWPRGHGIGWGDSFIHQARHFLGAVAGAWEVAPHGASFLDGLRCAQVCDAVVKAAETGNRERVSTDPDPDWGTSDE